MRTALVVLLVFAAADLIGCGLLLVVVWAEHRRQRRIARAAGQPLPSAAGQLALLAGLVVGGLALLYASLWYLLAD